MAVASIVTTTLSQKTLWLILTSTAKELSSLDKNSIESTIQNAKEKINDNEISDKEKYLLSYKIGALKELRK